MSLLGKLTSRLNIGARINGGFGVVLALLLAMATLGYLSLTGTRTTFEQYAFVSGTTLRMAEADRDIVSVRRNLREFIRTGNKESLDGVGQGSKEAREILDKVAATATTAEQREQAKSILVLLDQFMANFEAIKKVQVEGNHAVDGVMNPLGVKLSANIAEIVKDAMDDGDMAGAASAGAAQEQLMQARLDAYEYLLTNDTKVAQSTEKRFTALSAALKELSGVTNDDARQAKVIKVIKEIPNYVAAFRAAVKVVAERAPRGWRQRQARCRYRQDRVGNEDRAGQRPRCHESIGRRRYRVDCYVEPGIGGHRAHCGPGLGLDHRAQHFAAHYFAGP